MIALRRFELLPEDTGHECCPEPPVTFLFDPTDAAPGYLAK